MSRGIGTVQIPISEHVSKIERVLFIPDLATNLLSVSKITEKSFNVLFTSKDVKICQSGNCQVTGPVIATGSSHRGMYKLNKNIK